MEIAKPAFQFAGGRRGALFVLEGDAMALRAVGAAPRPAVPSHEPSAAPGAGAMGCAAAGQIIGQIGARSEADLKALMAAL